MKGLPVGEDCEVCTEKQRQRELNDVWTTEEESRGVREERSIEKREAMEKWRGERRLEGRKGGVTIGELGEFWSDLYKIIFEC